VDELAGACSENVSGALTVGWNARDASTALPDPNRKSVVPTLRATRSSIARALSTATVLLVLTSCSFADQQPDAGQPTAGSPMSSAPSEGSATDAATDTVDDACARILDMVRTAPEQLGTDPLGLLLEIDEIARTAPPELAGQITELRDAVESFRQGDESLISVVRKARQLQERCSA
jgi:hypothetical protein